VGTKTVELPYEQLINTFGNEFKILLTTPLEEIKRVTESRVVEAIEKVRSGDIVIKPGYDGVFGKVQVWPSSEASEDKKGIDQTSLF
jgi:PHP family Zn ribbon phosphoesterase